MKQWIGRGAVVLSLAALGSLAVSQESVPNFPNAREAEREGGDISLPSGKSQRDEILRIERERNIKDAAELAELADQLKEEIEKNDRFVFPSPPSRKRMRSRNWPRGFVLACVTSLAAGAVTGAQPAAKTPAIALLDSGDAPQWQNWTKELGWQVIAPTVPAGANIDVRIQAVEAAVEEAIAKSGVDPARVYMAGLGEEGSAVFYAISRVPDLWAAGLALGGSPQAALDTNHIYASNFTLTPVLWAGNGANDQALAAKLQSAGANLEFRPATTTMASVFEWLARHTRQEFPGSIDCETNSPVFARCSWIRLTKFDLAERNDVLPTTLIPGGTGAALDLGAFGYPTTIPALACWSCCRRNIAVR